MLENNFYHHSTRNYISGFGSIFNGIRISGSSGTIPVPLTFTVKEKFVQNAISLNSQDANTVIKSALPAMGFELLGMQFAQNRKTHTLNKICNGDGKVMFNRVPYTFGFALYIVSRKIDHALRVLEQITPYFSPSLNLRMRELEDYPDIITDIPVTLTGIEIQHQNDGSLEDGRRLVMYSLTFELQGYMYAESKVQSLINTAVIEFTNDDGFLEGSVCLADGTAYNLTESYEDSKNKVFTGATSESDLDV